MSVATKKIKKYGNNNKSKSRSKSKSKGKENSKSKSKENSKSKSKENSKSKSKENSKSKEKMSIDSPKTTNKKLTLQPPPKLTLQPRPKLSLLQPPPKLNFDAPTPGLSLMLPNPEPEFIDPSLTSSGPPTGELTVRTPPPGITSIVDLHDITPLQEQQIRAKRNEEKKDYIKTRAKIRGIETGLLDNVREEIPNKKQRVGKISNKQNNPNKQEKYEYETIKQPESKKQSPDIYPPPFRFNN